MHRHSVEPRVNGCYACAVQVALLDDVRQAIANMDDEGMTAGGQRILVMCYLSRRIRAVVSDGHLAASSVTD